MWEYNIVFHWLNIPEEPEITDSGIYLCHGIVAGPRSTGGLATEAGGVCGSEDEGHGSAFSNSVRIAELRGVHGNDCRLVDMEHA